MLGFFKNNKNVKRGIFALFLLLLIVSARPYFAQAINETVDKALNALNSTVESNKIIAETDNAPSTTQIVGKSINVVLSILGLAFFILAIYGGIIWLTAGGSSEKAERAVKILTQASIGIIIVTVAFLIANIIVFRYLEIASAPVEPAAGQ